MKYLLIVPVAPADTLDTGKRVSFPGRIAEMKRRDLYRSPIKPLCWISEAQRKHRNKGIPVEKTINDFQKRHPNQIPHPSTLEQNQVALDSNNSRVQGNVSYAQKSGGNYNPQYNHSVPQQPPLPAPYNGPSNYITYKIESNNNNNNNSHQQPPPHHNHHHDITTNIVA